MNDREGKKRHNYSKTELRAIMRMGRADDSDRRVVVDDVEAAAREADNNDPVFQALEEMLY